MDDMECPYCEAPQDVNHDDGAGYAEDERHEHECSECNKTFVFTTSISYYYEPEKADCLNGGQHVLSMSATSPIEYSQMQCQDCDFKRKPTDDEFEAAAARGAGKDASQPTRGRGGDR